MVWCGVGALVHHPLTFAKDARDRTWDTQGSIPAGAGVAGVPTGASRVPFLSSQPYSEASCASPKVSFCTAEPKLSFSK